MVRRLSCSDWESINWKRVNYHVRKVQKRIAEAALHQDWHKVRELQQLALQSYDCRLYAVHKVTTRKNIRTPGLDGLFLATGEDRFAAVNALDYRNYHPQPFKRFYVPKDHDKSRKRPLSVPVIFDRAAEALFLIAVDPVVETCADLHAYGFRKSRSSMDAIRYIVEEFGLLHGRQWVLKADVKGCFDNLSHDWIMQHIIFDKTVMQRVLKCGYVYRGKQYPLHEGMPQGGVLSPAVTTFALSGFEQVIEKEFAEYGVSMCRFVDDFIFSADSPDVLYNVRVRLSAHLAERGLWLAPEKTHIRHISEGVDFIGWHFQADGNKLQISPSEISIQEFKQRIDGVLTYGKRWTARRIIFRLNEVIRGWGYYHMYLCTPDCCAELDTFVQDAVWKWAVCKWPEKDPRWIYAHHWKENRETQRKEFSSEDAVLFLFSDIRVRMPRQIDVSKNPYIDIQYFRGREKIEYEYRPILSEHF